MNDFTNHYTTDEDQDFIDEFEHFEQEIVKLLETLKDCSPEEKAICLKNFIDIKKVINGHLE